MNTEIPHKVITLIDLEKMFDNMSKDFDTSKPLLWGYFFTHSDSSLLRKAAEILTNKGYSVVDIYLSDKESELDQDVYWLHIEKIEIHTPYSLDKRNDEFYILANEIGLDSYDGMDVDPVEK